MKSSRIAFIIPMIFILFSVFVLGFMVEDVRASKGDFTRWMAGLQLLPQRLEMVVDRTPPMGSKSNPLPVIDTYSTVIERVKSDYYGKEVDERKITYDAITGMLGALDDPFTRFMDPDEYKRMREENEGNFSGIGAHLDTNRKGEVYIKEPLPNAPAMKAGIKKNDVILAVDGKTIKDMDILDVVKLIRGPLDTKVKISVRRPGRKEPLDFTITRAEVQFQMVKSWMQDAKDKIGYVRLYQFNEQSDVQFDEALADLEKQKMKGLILDLRGNPGGLLHVAVDIGSRFIDSGPVVIIQERGGRKNSLMVDKSKHNHKRYPLVVVVDKQSASASEIVSGAIKDTKSGTLVGTTTFGKGRVQTIMALQDGSAVAITTAKYLTPNGTDIHKKGIDPDIVIEQPDVDVLLAGLTEEEKDEADLSDPKYDIQLSKATQVLKVKMGLLPESVLEDLKKTAKAGK